MFPSVAACLNSTAHIPYSSHLESCMLLNHGIFVFTSLQRLTRSLLATFFVIAVFPCQMFYLAACSSTRPRQQKHWYRPKEEQEKGRLRQGMKWDGDSRATLKLCGFYPPDEQAESIHKWDTLTHGYSGLLCVAFCSWKIGKNLVNKHNNVEPTYVL